MEFGENRPNLPSPYSPHELYERVIRTVVGVKSTQGLGSGVLIAPNGVVATNRHVVGADRQVGIRLSDGGAYRGAVIASFTDIDLAFVRTDLDQNSYGELSRNRKLQVGDAVYAIGHPLGLENTLTQGIISGIERVIEEAIYIQTDASVNPGNSGGPLYNAYGEIVGINTMGLRGSSGLNFAIPSHTVAAKYQELLDKMARGTQGYYCGVCGNSSSSPEYCDNVARPLYWTTPPTHHSHIG